jgi:hypothetical protein
LASDNLFFFGFLARAIVATTLLSGAAFSQTLRVLDARTDAPIPDALVSGSSETRVADARGAVPLRPFSEDDTLIVTHVAYRAARVALADLSDSAVVRLAPASILLEESLVEGERTAPVERRERFSPRDIEVAGAQSLGAALAKSGALEIRSYGGGGQLQIARARGAGGENTLVLFNEARVNDLRTGAFDFGAYDANAFERVEYSSGGDLRTARFASGGAVRLETGNPDGETNASALARFDDDEGRAASVAYRDRFGDYATAIDAGYSYSPNRYEYEFQDERYTRHNAHYERARFLADATRRGETYAANLFVGLRSFASGLPGYVSDNNQRGSNASRSDLTTLVVSDAAWAFAEGWSASATGSWNRQAATFEDPDGTMLRGERAAETDYDEFALDARMARADEFATLALGAEARRADLDDRGQYLNSTIGEVSMSRRSLRGYATATAERRRPFQGASQATAYAGLSYEGIEEPNFPSAEGPEFSYALGAAVVADLPFDPTLRLFHADGVRTPTFNERYYAAALGAREALLSERYRSSEAALSLGARDDVAYFSIAWFARETDDKIVWTPTVYGLQRPRNLRRAATTGLEFDATIRPFGEFLSLDASYDYLDARNRSALSADDRSFDKQIVYTPKHRARAAATLTLGDFGFAVIATYASRSYYTADNNPFSSLDPYLLVDAHARRRFALGAFTAEATLSCANVFDESYLVVQSYPMPLRTIAAAFRISYQTVRGKQ